MRWRGPLFGLSVPLAAAGCLAGHAAGYALVGTSRRDAHVHGYLSLAPQFVAICAVVLAAGLTLRVSGRLTGRVAAWPFALLPPLAFCAQELIERLVAGLPAHAVLEPAVFVGLAAQFPIAIIGFLAAQALLRVTDAAARVLRPLALPIAPSTLLLAPSPSPASTRARFRFDWPARAPPRS
jgi:hypothetical protein